MTTTVNVAEAKAQLSKLIALAIRGEKIVIANRGVPMVTLTPAERPRRRLGVVTAPLPDTFFDPLPEEELSAWEL